MEDANFVGLDFWKLFGDDVGDEVASSCTRRKRDLFLEPAYEQWIEGSARASNDKMKDVYGLDLRPR